ncbi:MAG: hypothetical protein WD749_08710 [Phycisphaerales bacterium]
MLIETDEGSGPAADVCAADGALHLVLQAEQLKNPDAVISVTGHEKGERLIEFADGIQGLATSDNSQFIAQFWEFPKLEEGWEWFQMAPARTTYVAGCSQVLHWQDGEGSYMEHALSLKAENRLGGWKSGGEAWGKVGVAVNRVGSLPVALYRGHLFDCNVAMIVPRDPAHVPAVWAFCQSEMYAPAVRKVNAKLAVTNVTLTKVPFDLAHWQRVAAEKYPNGLPQPQSDDPTQWMFHGHPAKTPASLALQVAVARLVGYRWPAELAADMRLAPEARAWVERCKALDGFADDDGVVPLAPMRGEPAAEGRVRDLLRAAFGGGWSGAKEATVLATVATANGGGGDKEPAASLDDWLRNRFFAEHCALFDNRPFVWHLWDGRKKDGFGVLVHYHRLAAPNGEGRRLLEKITHGYLGDWIVRQRDEVRGNKEGADARLAAALDLQKKLEAILQGDPPHDIFVRWKPLHKQPIGWEPDLNDAVRMNIRPFVEAGVLRDRLNIKWTTDRGQEPKSIRPKAEFPWFWDGATFIGDRVNDIHLTADQKQKARGAKESHT